MLAGGEDEERLLVVGVVWVLPVGRMLGWIVSMPDLAVTAMVFDGVVGGGFVLLPNFSVC